MSKKHIALLTIIVAVLVDQITKIYVKTHFEYNESVKVFDWFQILFVENNGMAMGIELGGNLGKLFLTLFRLLVVPVIVYWLIITLKKNMPTVVVVAIALIFSGAIGNIIDSVFYGVIFDSPKGGGVATLFAENPYGSLFHGKVVDMFYFPIIKNATWPEWIPFIGGDSFSFFPYIFNPADAYITVGVALLFICSKKAFPKEEKEK
ncbi:MAG: lipoprotein signal peptidase [Flavobacteriaceae bacterium]|nr:MAG: lipoprotein signal peptidase [Flavobacteriaceae bacterium]